MTTTHVILISVAVCWCCGVVFLILIGTMLRAARWFERRGSIHRAKHAGRSNA